MTVQFHNIPLCIYPKEMKTYVQTKSCKWMFIAALFIITKRCKPKYPSMDEYTKCGNTHSIEYYLAIKRNKALTHAAT